MSTVVFACAELMRCSRWAEGEEIEMATGMLWNGASYFSLD